MTTVWSRSAAASLFALLIAFPSHAEKVCVRAAAAKRGRKVNLSRLAVPSAQACPKKYIELIDTAVLTGPPGATGPAGADGQLRIFGDGSAGALEVPADAEDYTLGENRQYTDLIIAAGAEVSLASGTVIRCTGSFINNGTVRIRVSAYGEQRRGIDPDLLHQPTAPAHPGAARAAAGGGDIRNDFLSSVDYGLGGIGLEQDSARSLRFPGPHGGGGGGCTRVAGCRAPHGGGTLLVLCRGKIENHGIIFADGASAGPADGGGGGGGIIILASADSIVNGADGTLRTAGGKGGDATSGSGSGGGGGGHQLPSRRESCISIRRAMASTTKVTMKRTKPSSSSAER